MNILQKLADLANKLDAMGQTAAADQIDGIIKEAGFMDWITKSMTPVKCTCDCEVCQAGQARGGPHALQYHNMCNTGKCEIKKAQQKS